MIRFNLRCVIVPSVQILAFSLAMTLALGAGAQEDGAGSSEAPFEPPSVGRAAEGSAVDNYLVDVDTSVPSRRSPWGLSLFDWATVNVKNAREGEGRLETYNYLSFDYRLDWQSKISVRPEFYLSGAGRDYRGFEQASEVDLGDVYLQYSRNGLGVFATPLGDLGLSGAFRVYYPNSKFSKQQKQVTHLQARLMLEMPLGMNFWLVYHFRPAYFVQSQQAYLNENFNVKANEHYRLEQRLEVMKILGRKVAAHQEVSLESRDYYASNANNLSERVDDYFGLTTSLSWYTGGVSLKGGVSWETKVADPRRSRAVYDPSDTTYYLMTNVRL